MLVRTARCASGFFSRYRIGPPSALVHSRGLLRRKLLLAWYDPSTDRSLVFASLASTQEYSKWRLSTKLVCGKHSKYADQLPAFSFLLQRSADPSYRSENIENCRVLYQNVINAWRWSTPRLLLSLKYSSTMKTASSHQCSFILSFLRTLYLFTKSDIRTTVIPIVSFISFVSFWHMPN